MQIKPWLGVVLAGLLVSVGAVGAGAVSADAVAPKAETLEVVAKRTLMSATPNIAVGGGFVAGGELFDGREGARVGDGYSHCGVVSVSVAVPPAVTTHCTSVFRLQNGELHLSGMREYKSIAAGFDNATVAVVGGTGAYANARGEGTVTRTSAQAVEVGYRFVLSLATD